MSINTQTRPWLRLCTGALAAGGVAFSMLGFSGGVAGAGPPPARIYHHPGRRGDKGTRGGAPSESGNTCRDWDDYYGGPAGSGAPPPWARPMPPPPPWAPWAQV